MLTSWSAQKVVHLFTRWSNTGELSVLAEVKQHICPCTQFDCPNTLEIQCSNYFDLKRQFHCCSIDCEQCVINCLWFHFPHLIGHISVTVQHDSYWSEAMCHTTNSTSL